MIKRILLGVITLTLCACQPKTQFLNNDIQGAGLATRVPLNTDDGQPLQLNAPHPAQVTVVFFGFTQCPDVCPTTMGEMKLVKQKLGADADKLRVVLVSIDPERDTAAVLKQYTEAFDPHFIGASTSPQQTKILAKDLNISYEKVGSEPFYTMKHSANSYLVDPQGRFRVSIPYGTKPESIAHDVKQLLAE